MPYVNEVMIMGHAGRDAEYRWSGDLCFGEFSLAIKRPYKVKGEEVTDWITVKMSGNTAKNWEEWGIHKGDVVMVKGALEVDEWEKDGQKRSKTYVKANWIYFSKKWNEGTQNTTSATSSSAPASLSMRDDPSFMGDDPQELAPDTMELPVEEDADIPF